MLAGIDLSAKEKNITGIAFLDEEIETHSVEKDEEILDLLKGRKPEIVAIDAPLSAPEDKKGFREGEEELIEEGYALLPYGMRGMRRLSERALSLRARVIQEVDMEFMECHPTTTGEVLDVKGDEDLENYGINTEVIKNTHEFDAVLAVLTALFYKRGDYEDHDIIVPSMEED